MVTYGMILFILNTQNRQIQRHRNQITGCQQLWEEVKRNDCFWGEEMFWELENGDGSQHCE